MFDPFYDHSRDPDRQWRAGCVYNVYFLAPQAGINTEKAKGQKRRYSLQVRLFIAVFGTDNDYIYSLYVLLLVECPGRFQTADIIIAGYQRNPVPGLYPSAGKFIRASAGTARRRGKMLMNIQNVHQLLKSA
jgi:hypothetical protein